VGRDASGSREDGTRMGQPGGQRGKRDVLGSVNCTCSYNNRTRIRRNSNSKDRQRESEECEECHCDFESCLNGFRLQCGSGRVEYL
jgi:hypothetical protein